jgi:plastocyanin
MRKLVPLLATLALAPFALAACGGDDEPETSATEDVNPTSEAIEVSAVPDGSFAFEQSELDAPAGALNTTFTNPAPIAHDFCLEDPDGEELGCTSLVADGDTDIAEFDVEPGEYTYFCSVAGHREGGMEGTLTVE